MPSVPNRMRFRLKSSSTRHCRLYPQPPNGWWTAALPPYPVRMPYRTCLPEYFPMPCQLCGFLRRAVSNKPEKSGRESGRSRTWDRRRNNRGRQTQPATHRLSSANCGYFPHLTPSYPDFAIRPKSRPKQSRPNLARPCRRLRIHDTARKPVRAR